MPNYRRARVPGATYFFTVNLLERHGNDLLVHHIDLLREVVKNVHARHPFHIDGWVVLPEHLHAIWTLPPDDTNYSMRWRQIKADFSRQLPKAERRSPARLRSGERGIWQRRFWEHLIRDDTDYIRHMDYLHFNPVKHGLAAKVADWPHSTFHRLVKASIYPHDWGGSLDTE